MELSRGAGLTTKPLRDRPIRRLDLSTSPIDLTWAVSPAAGIGLLIGASTRRLPNSATTDPDGCHAKTLVASALRQQRAAMAAVYANCRRRLVAAITATPRICAPAADVARAASVAVAPVVQMSSTTTTLRPSRRRRARVAKAPARFAARSAALSPAWSPTGRTTRSAGSMTATTPAFRNERAHSRVTRSSGSCPRSRTVRRIDGAGTRVINTADESLARHRTPRTLNARARPSGLASESRPCSLCATSASLTTSP